VREQIEKSQKEKRASKGRGIRERIYLQSLQEEFVVRSFPKSDGKTEKETGSPRGRSQADTRKEYGKRGLQIKKNKGGGLTRNNLVTGHGLLLQLIATQKWGQRNAYRSPQRVGK